MDYLKDLVETWEMNNKVTLYLLENIEEDWLGTKLCGKGRCIGEQFIHINSIRSMWINKVGEKINLKLDKKNFKDKSLLQGGLVTTSEKMVKTLIKIFENDKIKGYKPHPIAFFAQMIAHESHHRGQIMTTISRNDLKINKSVNFGLWTWHTK